MQKNVQREFYNAIAKALRLDAGTPVVAVSPHIDDAVWSLGPVLKALAEHGHELRIVDLFSASLSEKDENSLPVSGTAMRKAEDGRAGRAVGCKDIMYLDFPDGILRDRDPQTIFDPAYETPVWLAGRLLTALQASIPTDATLLVPSGFGWHIDHQLAGRVASKLPQRIIYYEDMPYAAFGVRLQEAWDFLHQHDAEEARIPVDSDIIEEHLRLYRLYDSQRDAQHEEQISTYLAANGYGLWLSKK